ncbi:hypothetical protein [Polyangium aurulentum]|uniref:hypothetical protein n=1 Tax=Polyangium aurulentum TaxID=2567896 RepID=UPI0010AE0C29|nr:hypothetical protein [Polyangium aurulentum]UQA58193.1 hypothetical protein E8A73_044240 [Polyangium aurulentum]
MKTMRALAIGILSAGMLLGALAGEALAGEGVLIAPDRLAPQDRAALVTAIDAAKAQSPSAFQTLAELRRDLPTLDANKRGRLVAITPILKGMGKEALLPMLNELAVDAKGRGDLTETAWLAWRVGLLEAVGMLRDSRSTAVLGAIVEGPESEFPVVRAAASAYGKLGTDAVAQKLIALAKVKSPKQKGILAGMGDCRRRPVADALASMLAARPDADTATLLARSLGDVGSSWAWQTPVIAASGEESAVRAIAAKALVGSYLRYEGETREAIAKAILLVDHDATPSLLATAKANAGTADQAALDALAQRFSKNPIRR